MKRPIGRSLLMLGTAICVTHATAAQAQQADAAPDSRASASDTSGDIVVTAQRREERLQDVPVSLSAISDELIRSQIVIAPEDIARLAPGVSATVYGTIRNGASYTIRGQGASALGNDIAVVTYFDEVATSAPGPGYMFDLDSVNVLKGPQGTLFGRNTTGGAVLLVPQAPTNELEGYVDVSLGNYSLKRIQAALNIPLAEDKILLRLAADVFRRDGFTRDINTGRDYDDRNYHAFRGTLLIRPAEWLENKTLINFSYAFGNQAGASMVNVDPAGRSAAVFRGLAAEVTAQQERGPRRVAYNLQNGESIFRALAINNVTTFHLSDDTMLKNIFGYRDSRVVNATDVDGTIFPVIGYLHPPAGWQTFPYPDPSQKAISEELQINGTALDDSLSYTTGVYYERRNPAKKDSYDLFYYFNPSAVTFRNNFKYDRSLGVYAQITYAFTEQLKATFGGRYTWDKRHQISSTYPVATGCSGGFCNLDQRVKFDAPTYTLNLQYTPQRDLMVYVASRRGYKSGGFNAISASSASSFASFAPEYVTDYELGAKGVFRIAETTVRTNLALYRSNFRDRQVLTSIFNGTINNVTVNAGKGNIQGVEFDGSVDVSSRLILSMSFALTDAKFTYLTLNGIDYSSQRLPMVSKYSINLSGEYIFVKSEDLGEISMSANYSWQSKFAASLATTGSGESTNPLGPLTPGYGQLNMRIDWRDVAGRDGDIGIFATNILNKTHMIAYSDLYNVIGYSTALYNEPRMFGVQVRQRF